MARKQALHILDHGWLECDRRLHYPLDSIATNTNKNPTVPWERIPTFSMLLEHSQCTIVIDTGSHPNSMKNYWPQSLREQVPWYYDSDDLFINRIEQVGYSTDDIDMIIQTHLHHDHAGNLYRFAELDVPIYVHSEELKWAFYIANVFDRAEDRGAYVPKDFTNSNLSWQPLHGNRDEVINGVEWLLLPGHTPGCIGLLISIFEEPLLIVGDSILREGNVFPDITPPAVNWDQNKWQTITVPKVQKLNSKYDLNRIHGHDPAMYNQYSSYPDVNIVGETCFDNN